MSTSLRQVSAASTPVDSLLVPQCIYRPGTFTGLMTLYESNYVRFLQLADRWDWAGDTIVSRTPRDSALYAEVLRREAYTTTMRLTYRFDELNGVRPEPDLVLRVYHDARLVEAVSSGSAERHLRLREWAGSGGADLDERWRRNMLLSKWLEYLFEVGHSLARGVKPPP